MSNKAQQTLYSVIGRIVVLGLILWVALKVTAVTIGIIGALVLGLVWFLFPIVILPAAIIVGVVALLMNFTWKILVYILVIWAAIYLLNRLLDQRKF